jgi:hypothetical protein
MHIGHHIRYRQSILGRFDPLTQARRGPIQTLYTTTLARIPTGDQKRFSIARQIQCSDLTQLKFDRYAFVAAWACGTRKQLIGAQDVKPFFGG